MSPRPQPRSLTGEVRATVALALPLITGQLATIGMNTVDALLAGHLGAQVLGPVAVGTGLFHLANIAALGINAAVSPSVAQLAGAGRRGEVGPVFRQALAIGLVLGVGLMLLVAFVMPLVSGALGLPAELAGDTRAFLRAISPAILAWSLFYACRGLSEGLALPRPTMALGLLGLALLVPSGYALMYGAFGLPRLGAFGCGLATSLVAWVQLAGFALWLRLSPRYRGLGWRSGGRRVTQQGVVGLLRIGVPMAVAWLLESSLFTTAGLVIATFGAAAVASHQVALNVAAFVFMVPLGLSIAVTVRVGHAAGRGDPLGVRRAGLTGMSLAFGFQALSALLLLTLPKEIAALYTDDPAVRAGAVTLLRIAGIFQLSDGLQVSAAGALRGLKDTRVPMVITALAYWGVGMPTALALAFGAGWQAAGMWCGLIAGLTAAAGLLAARFVSLSGRLRRTLAVTA
jgi:multidrug resistance protein, MATE family